MDTQSARKMQKPQSTCSTGKVIPAAKVSWPRHSSRGADIVIQSSGYWLELLESRESAGRTVANDPNISPLLDVRYLAMLRPSTLGFSRTDNLRETPTPSRRAAQEVRLRGQWTNDLL